MASEFKECIRNLGDHIFVSFDIDAVSGDFAPGVSAVATVGLNSLDAVEIAEISGKACITHTHHSLLTIAIFKFAL